MNKIPTMFVRNPARRQEVLTDISPGCEWVLNGEGVATRKYDGTCCLVRDGKLYKRREIKTGGVLPDGFELVSFDPVTGKSVGWVPIDAFDATDKWHRDAFTPDLVDGTYELIGPKIQGNPEGLGERVLLRHDTAEVFLHVPRDFGGLREWLYPRDIEGIVFHHPDGRMAKIKKRDFGLRRSTR